MLIYWAAGVSLHHASDHHERCPQASMPMTLVRHVRCCGFDNLTRTTYFHTLTTIPVRTCCTSLRQSRSRSLCTSHIGLNPPPLVHVIVQNPLLKFEPCLLHSLLSRIFGSYNDVIEASSQEHVFEDYNNKFTCSITVQYFWPNTNPHGSMLRFPFCMRYGKEPGLLKSGQDTASPGGKSRKPLSGSFVTFTGSVFRDLFDARQIGRMYSYSLNICVGNWAAIPVLCFSIVWGVTVNRSMTHTMMKLFRSIGMPH